MRSRGPGWLLATAAVVLALATGVAYAATAPPIISFTPETYTAFQQQLASGKVRAITFNKVPHSVHITLDNHDHLLAVYPPQDFTSLDARIRAAGIPILIEHPHGKPAPVHHRLRYIAAAVLVILIVVVAIVLMLNRRRTQQVADAPAAPAAAAPPPPEA